MKLTTSLFYLITVMQKLNIYGDNILECEEALRLITSSLEMELVPVDGPLFTPLFHLLQGNKAHYEIKLFPGYDRWQYDIKKVMGALGAKLREATDAVITKLTEEDGVVKEIPILAMEFCGALPAGNNAWQRSGRALSCAQSGIPYLYFAELGGVELGAERVVKASRFPNPIVPFAYLSLGKTYDSVTLPIYQPSPSISLDLFNTFKPFFAGEEVNSYIKSVLLGEQDPHSKEIIEEKAVALTTFLASKRKDKDGILSPDEWKHLASLEDGNKIADWLIKKGMKWKKKITIPTSSTFIKLLSAISSLEVSAVGSKDMPFCLLSPAQREKLIEIVKEIYKDKIDENFINWLNNNTKPLFIAWVAGFKPRGDDSRPDRGLVPLLRMVIGEDGIDVLTIVYGPIKKEMLGKLEKDMWGLARTNGLWQAVINYSNGLIVDTATSQELSSVGFKITAAPEQPLEPDTLAPSGSITPIKFGEHDVDTVLHEIFYLHKDDAFFEGLCNPPGGNWSGISLYNFNDGVEIRWVSLPRVSGEKAKRPDHLFQIMLSQDTSNILTIESKETPLSVEKGIGKRLISYIIELMKVAPNVFRTKDEVSWQSFTGEYLKPKVNIFSVAAFKLTTQSDLRFVQKKSGADVVLGVEFLEDGAVCLHLRLSKETKWLGDFLNNRTRHFNGWLKVKIHGL